MRGLALQARLGVYPHEKAAPQRVVIGIELAVEDDGRAGRRRRRRPAPGGGLRGVAARARAAAADGHTLLVETLAERIAAAALADPRVLRARVTVEKPDAFPDAASVGVAWSERMRG